jgi:glutamine synthetase type III
MLYSNVLPAALETRKNLAEAAVNLKTLGVSFESEKNLLKSLGDLIASLEETGGKLSKAIETVAVLHDNADSVAASTILPLMNGIRDLVDRLEICVPDKVWPFPKLTDILFSI